MGDRRDSAQSGPAEGADSRADVLDQILWAQPRTGWGLEEAQVAMVMEALLSFSP